MSDRVLHLLEDIMICVVVLLLGAYVLLSWAGAADKPELVATYYSEGMRVLKPDGVLIFKWSEYDIPAEDVWKAIGQKPLFGHHAGGAHPQGGGRCAGRQLPHRAAPRQVAGEAADHPRDRAGPADVRVKRR